MICKNVIPNNIALIKIKCVLDEWERNKTHTQL